jgi:hypothetical protein
MSDVTITQASVFHSLSATTPDDPTAEIQPQHWNSGHGATITLAAAAVIGLFSNVNGISFGTTDGAITGSYTVPTQSVQTQPSGNIAGVGFTSTTTAGTDIKATQNTAGLSMAVPAYLTTYAAQSVQTQPSGAIAGTGFTTATTAGTEIKGTLNTAGLSMGVPAYLTAAAGGGFSAGVSGGNTSGDTGATGTRVVFAGGNNITLSQATNANGATITVSGPNTAAQSAQSAIEGLGVSNVGNTAGNTGVVTGVDFVLAGSGSITLSQETAAGQRTIHVQHPAWLTTAALSNHSHGNPQLNLTNLSGTTASNSAGFTLSLSAAAPGGGSPVNVSAVEVMDGARFTTACQWNNGTYSNRPIFVPFENDNTLVSMGTIRLFASRSTGTLIVATLAAGIYSRVNETSASRISSTSMNISVSTSAQFSGVRMYDITGLSAMSLAPGRYLFGLLGSAAATNSLPLHLMGGDALTGLAGFVLSGTNSTAATATNSHVIPMWGVYSATSGALPANVAASEISGGGSQNSPDIYAILKAV